VNPRERMLALVIVGLVMVGGLGFLFKELYLTPLSERDQNIQALQEAIDTKKKERDQALADQKKLGRWRRLSLPSDIDVARREYGKYLTDLLIHSGFAGGTFTVTPQTLEKTAPTLGSKKQPIYTKLTYKIQGPGRLENLVKMLEEFYKTGLLQQIKYLDLQQPQLVGTNQQRQGELNVNITVEALVVTGADDRSFLLPNIDRRLVAFDLFAGLTGGPMGLGMAAWAAGPTGPRGPGSLATDPPRQYAAIGKKNIFTGPATPPPSQEREGVPVDVARYVHLTDISRVDGEYEASLWDRFNDSFTRLRNSNGYNQFRVKDNLGETLLTGKVVYLNARDLIFSSGDKFYRMHVGDTVDDGLKNSIPPEKVELLLKGPTAASLDK
jgi:hypothetical protein